MREAIELDSESAAAYCLLAQVLEGKQSKQQEIITTWELCLIYASSYNVDEDAWSHLARQRLLEIEE